VVVKMLFPFSEPFPHAALNGEGKCECIELLYLPLLLFVFHHFHRLPPSISHIFHPLILLLVWGKESAANRKRKLWENGGRRGWENEEENVGAYKLAASCTHTYINFAWLCGWFSACVWVCPLTRTLVCPAKWSLWCQ